MGRRARLIKRQFVLTAEQIETIMTAVRARTGEDLTYEHLQQLMVKINEKERSIEKVTDSKIRGWIGIGIPDVPTFTVFDAAIRMHCDECKQKRDEAIAKVRDLETFLGLGQSEAS